MQRLSLSFVALAFILLSFISQQQSATIPSANAEPISPEANSIQQPAAPISSLKFIIILAEFPDARHTLSAEEMKKRILTEVTGYYREASYGTLSLTGDITDWITLPGQFSAFGNMTSSSDSETWVRRRKLASDAIKAADDAVDFKKYGFCIIVVPPVGLRGYSTRVSVPTNDGVTNFAVTVQPERSSASVFAHEVGHVLRLPDLYDHAQADTAGVAGIYVGQWCLMSSSGRGSMHFCAYSKIVLEWIPKERIKVVPRGAPELVTLEPIEVKTPGIQAIKILLSSESYYLVEARRKIGFDQVLPDEGVLITLVDHSIKGDGFIKAIDAKPTTKTLDDATFDASSGKENTFIDTSRNVAVVVLWADDKAQGIYITTPTAAEGISKGFNEVSNISRSVCQAQSRIDQANAAKFKSPQAQSLLNSAKNKYVAAITAFNTPKYDLAMQESNSIMSLIDQAFAAEQTSGKATGETPAASTQPENAIKAAEAASVEARGIGGSYYWYIGAAVAVVIVAGIAFMLVRKRKAK